MRFSFKVKAGEDDGAFSGYVSTFGNTDLGDDRCITGCFAGDLAQNGPRRPVLWNHDTSQPIGYIDLREDARGLFGKGQLILDVQRAREIRALMLAGVVTKMSMGYETLDHKFVKGVRELRRVRIYEASCVTFPMNPEASITTAKSGDDLDGICETIESLNAALREEADRRAAKPVENLLHGLRSFRSQL